jgi:hypothetical protein
LLLRHFEKFTRSKNGQRLSDHTVGTAISVDRRKQRESTKMQARKRPLIIHYANAEDETTGDAFEVFRFRKVGNRRGEIRIERDKLPEAKHVYNLLLSKNADFDLSRQGNHKQVKAAAESPPRVKLLYASRTGWRPDRSAFVSPHGVVGGKDRVRKLMPPTWLNQYLPSIRKRGDFASWKAMVPKICGYSDAGMIVLSAAFAAPLGRIVGLQPFGLNFFGRAKIGKSALLLAGSSVAGSGNEPDLPNWSDTQSARGELCRCHNDILLPANEIGLITGKKRDAYPEIRRAVFLFSEGREHHRHSKSAYATPDIDTSYFTIFVSTAEHSVGKYAEMAEETQDDGEIARCTDLPAQRKGYPNVMDRFPASVPPERRRQWARRQIGKLRDTCKDNHGVALAPYVEYLMSVGDALKADIERYMKEFLREISPARLEEARSHAARNLALVYAGGCLAIDANILPWDKARLLGVITQRFLLHAHAERKKHHEPALSGIDLLKAGLRHADIRERRSSSRFCETDCDGYYVVQDGRKKYVIHAKAFREWFRTDPGERQKVIRLLKTGGHLIPCQTRSAAAKKDWEVQTPKWPHGKSVRSVVFFDPFMKQQNKHKAISRTKS